GSRRGETRRNAGAPSSRRREIPGSATRVCGDRAARPPRGRRDPSSDGGIRDRSAPRATSEGGDPIGPCGGAGAAPRRKPADALGACYGVVLERWPMWCCLSRLRYETAAGCVGFLYGLHSFRTLVLLPVV